VGLVHGYAGGTNTLAASRRISTNPDEAEHEDPAYLLRHSAPDLNVLNGTGFDFGLSTSVPNTALVLWSRFTWRTVAQDEVDQDALAWATSNWPISRSRLILAPPPRRLDRICRCGQHPAKAARAS